MGALLHEIVALLRKQLPQLKIECRELSFGGDMRDVALSGGKIARVLGFRTEWDVEKGIEEIRNAIESGLIKEPLSPRYRNHQFIVN